MFCDPEARMGESEDSAVKSDMEMIWKKHIKDELQRRDRSQKEGYEGLLETYLKLLERLDLQNFLAEKLQLEPNRNDFSGSPTHSSARQSMCLEMAELRIQHQLEMAELYKARAELTQTVLDLNKTLQLKDIEIQDHRARISKQAHDIASLTKRCMDQEAYMDELERQHQLLQDEHAVLQLTYMAVDERLQMTEDENKQLVTRWMEEKGIEADRLNRCNEQEETYRRLVGKLRRRLEKLKRSPTRSSAQVPEQTVTDRQSEPKTTDPNCFPVQEPNEAQNAIVDPITSVRVPPSEDGTANTLPPEGDQEPAVILYPEDAAESSDIVPLARSREPFGTVSPECISETSSSALQ